MKTKVKKFSHKLLALFMALVMGITCLSGVLTAQASSADTKYLDENLEYNQLAWRLMSDEQTATALLDYLDDDILPNVIAPMIEDLLGGVNINELGGQAVIGYNKDTRILNIKLLTMNGSVAVKVRSVNELIETIDSLSNLLTNSDFSDKLPTLRYAYLTALHGMSREKNTSCEILSGVFGLLRQISFNAGSNHTSSKVQNDILGELLRGDFELVGGSLVSFLTGLLKIFGVNLDLNLYNMLRDLLAGDGIKINLQSGYQSNFAYNLVKAVLLDKSGFFTPAEIAKYNSNPETFKFDTVLLEKLGTSLLQKINVLVTYDSAKPTGQLDKDGNPEYITENSGTRKAEINKLMETSGKTYAEACVALGYDPNLVYSEEIKYNDDGTVKDDFTNNILLFVYGDEKLELKADDSLTSFAFRALEMAWKTVLKDTLGLLHVNNDVNRGHGSNFDNQFYYWSQTKDGFEWNYADVASNYSQANLQKWADAVWQDESYNAKSAADFLENVKNTFEYDRTSLETSDGSWEDIDATTLFGKLRYSPMADYGFNMQTGPINLYFLQTGFTNLKIFFETSYKGYGSMVAAFNDALVAAVKDIFVERDNIIGSVPTMRTGNSTDPATIANMLTANALDIIEYTADATDANLLKAFRANPKYQGQSLSESNLEDAMLPMLIACIGQVDLGDAPLCELIHPEDWNACKDAEGIAYLALREYLSYVLPNKNYDVLVTTDENGMIEATLEGTIMPMARDALGYIMEPLVPLYDYAGQPWKAEDSKVDDTNTTIFTLLNSVVCYYANDYDLGSKGRTNGVASLLGVCDAQGNSLINSNNDIWENFDIIIKKLVPVIGELQYGVKGAEVNSKDLVWNDIVLGILDIGDTSLHTSGLGGVSNFIYRFMTICKSPVVAETRVPNVAYNFLRDLLNGIFGVRYDNQKFGELIPANEGATPFDDFMQKEVLAGTDNQYSPGAVQKLIIRIAEAMGYGGYGANTVGGFPDSVWRGATFALHSVLSFFPNILPILGDNGLYMGKADIKPSNITGIDDSYADASTVSFKNNITGLNTAYTDNGQVIRQDRYTVKITSACYYDAADRANTEVPIDEWTNLVLQPGEKVSTDMYSFFSNLEGNGTTTWVTEVRYDIIYVDGTPITDVYNKVDCDNYKNLVSTAYQYMSNTPSWREAVYPDGSTLNGSFAPTSASASQSDAYGNTIKTTAKFNSNWIMQYPEYVLLTASSPRDVVNYRINFRSDAKEKGMDGVYTYDTTTVYDTVTGQNVNVDINNAKVLFDQDANVLNLDLYDYKYAGKDWDRNYTSKAIETPSVGSHATAYYNFGYTYDQLQEIRAGLTPEQEKTFETRTHVAYTLQELRDKGMFKALTRDADGKITALYIQSSDSQPVKYGVFNASTAYPNRYSYTLDKMTMAGPVAGTYISVPKMKDNVVAGDNRTRFIGIADTSALVPGRYTMNITGNAGQNTAGGTINLVVVDDSAKSQFESAYNNFISELNKYCEADFKDYNAETKSSASFNAAVKAAANALATLSTPLSVSMIDTINTVYLDGIAALETAKETMYNALDTTLINELFNFVSLTREGLNENNFDITSFNRMTEAARKAERQYVVIANYVDSQGIKHENAQLSYSNWKDLRDKTGNYWADTDAEFVGVYTELSRAQITEHIRNFNFYQHQMLERGYLGDQIEKEIECAGGAAYSTFEVTPAVVDENGNITTNAVVKNTSIAAPQFGKYVDGVLVNEGDITYPAALWNNYLRRLADAVKLAQLGNGDYAHKEQAKYVVGADDYDANNTTCYRADSLLQVAEIALENTYVVDMQATEGGSVQMTYGDGAAAETFTNAAKVAIPWKDYVTITPVADANYEVESLSINGEAVELDENGQYTGKITADSVVTAAFTGGAATTKNVTGSLVIATTSKGVTKGNGVTGDYTITVYDESGAEVLSQVFAMTADNNTFSLDLAPGTYTAKIDSEFAATREDITIVVGDSDITGPAIPMIVCNFNGDGGITAADALAVYKASGKGDLRYDLNGDGGVTAADALVVYSCTGTLSLSPITID